MSSVVPLKYRFDPLQWWFVFLFSGQRNFTGRGGSLRDCAAGREGK